MKQCKQCGHLFTSVSSKYYCCDKLEPVCITCRKYPCLKCKKTRMQQLMQPRCDKCYSKLLENDLLLQYNCDKYYCSRCLSDIFKGAYSQVAIQKKFDQKNKEILVGLYCGHKYSYNDLLSYFEHFCLQCGKRYDTITDYELCDGAKICSVCFRYYERKYQSVFLKCVGCDSILQNSEKAEVVDKQGTILCQRCVSESKIEETEIHQSRKISENKNIESSKSQDKSLKVEKEELMPNKSILKQMEVEVKNQSEESTKDISKKSSSPLNNFLKKPSISQLKEKQLQRKKFGDKEQHSYSVTSKFSNEIEDVDEELLRELGIKNKIKLKKHLSNETYVENFPVQIPPISTLEFFNCNKCGSLTLTAIGFDISKITTKQNLESKGAFSQFKQPLKIQKQNPCILCRVCYFMSAERQNERLKQKNITSFKKLEERPSRIEEKVPKMSYLKVQNSPKRRGNVSPSPNSNKQYSLTGSKHSLRSKDSKSNVTENISKQKKPIKQPENLRKESEKKVHNPINSTQKSASFKQCGLCGKQKKTLIMTMRQGYLCDDCYYRKSPHSLNVKK